MTINGAACGLRRVSRTRIDFLVPEGLASAAAGTRYDMIINNNGTVMTTGVTIVPARPDIFNMQMLPVPGGRTRAFNVTNTAATGEPFTVTTRRIRPFGRTATVLRIYMTGIMTSLPANTRIRIGTTSAIGTTVVSESKKYDTGIWYIDCTLPPDLAGAGDVPVIVTITIDGVSFSSRFDDTASRIFIV